MSLNALSGKLIEWVILAAELLKLADRQQGVIDKDYQIRI